MHLKVGIYFISNCFVNFKIDFVQNEIDIKLVIFIININYFSLEKLQIAKINSHLLSEVR